MIDVKPAPVTASVQISRSTPGWLSDAVGVLCCCLGSLLALLPLTGPGMIATHDGMIHIQRLIALDGAVRQGALLPRWLPDLAYGYGEPVFLYYAPLAYLPALTARLAGLSYVASVAFAGGLAVILSGLAMYLLARSFAGPAAASVSGIVYATLPYQLVDLYVRGALAESWAFVWVPLTTWCIVRAFQTHRARWSVGLAVTIAGLISTHNITALLFAPALVVLGLCLWLTLPVQRRSAWVRPAAGFMFGLGLSAWFWLPALAERGLVQLGEILEPDLFASFLIQSFPPFRLNLLFDYNQPVSSALGYPIFWPQVGLLQALLSILGAAAIVRSRRAHRPILLWAVLLVVGGIVVQLGPAARLYDLVPLLSFVQFPWRLLAIVGLGSALLAAFLIESLPARFGAQIVVAGLVVVASLVTGLARLEPERSFVDERFLTADSSLRSEIAGYGLGTTHSGEYLPASSGQRNAARFHKSLLDDPGRPAGSDVPSTLSVEDVEWRTGLIQVALTSQTSDVLRVHQFSFPGWSARLDGIPAATIASEPFGALGVQVPAGSHLVEFVWSQTPLRLIAVGMSFASVVLLVGLGGLKTGKSVKRGGLPRSKWPFAVGILALVVAAGASFVLTLIPVPPTSPSTTRSETEAARDVGSGLVLVNSAVDASRLALDGTVTTDLTWFVRSQPTRGYRARLDVVAADGSIHSVPWLYETPSRYWQRGEVVTTAIAARLPDAFAAGPAELRVAFGEPAGLSPLVIGHIEVPRRNAQSAGLAPPGGVTLVPGFDVAPAGFGSGSPWPSAQIRAGDALDVDLLWRADRPQADSQNEYLTAVTVAGPGGDISSEPARPGEWFAPLPFWQAGDEVRQRIRIVLPSSLQPGIYSAVARIYPRELARGGMSAPGTVPGRPRGRPVAELPLGDVTVSP